MKYAEYVNRLFAKSAKRGIPLSGTFELTARCNLRCRMCYIHREENDGEIKTDEFSSEEWLNIAKWKRSNAACCFCADRRRAFYSARF